MNILDAAAVDDFAFLPGDPKKVAETKVTSHESRLTKKVTKPISWFSKQALFVIFYRFIENPSDDDVFTTVIL